LVENKEDKLAKVWQAYNDGKAYQKALRLEEIIPLCVDFMEGRHWGKVSEKTKTLPRPIFNQIEMIVNSIMSKYFYFRIEDVCLCFKKAREDSSYRRFYGRVDGSVFLDWFAQYDKERENVLQSHPSNNQSYTDLSRGVSALTEDDLLAMIAGGDLYANQMLQAKRLIEGLFNRDKGVSKNYQYNRKHRFDKK
jgi:hypothetical protein